MHRGGHIGRDEAPARTREPWFAPEPAAPRHLHERRSDHAPDPCGITTLADLRRALNADSFAHLGTVRALERGEAA